MACFNVVQRYKGIPQISWRLTAAAAARRLYCNVNDFDFEQEVLIMIISQGVRPKSKDAIH